MISLLIRPGFPQNVCQLSIKAISFAGHHRDNQRWSDDMRLNISLLVELGRGPEKATDMLRHGFCIVTYLLNITFRDLRLESLAHGL